MTPQRAYRIVRTALKQGVLVRPLCCSRCGNNPGPASDGRAKIHAHHHDYNKPLEVEWLCAKCHRADTPLPEVMGNSVPGERNGQSKLTNAQAASIRNDPRSQRVLARIYGVDRASIGRIKRGEAYANVG